MLIRIAPSFICETSIMWRVSGVSGTCSDTQSARRSSASSSTSSTPAASATSAFAYGSKATTSRPNACALRATWRPMRPKPTSPSVERDSRATDSGGGTSMPPRRTERSNANSLR